jgi:hypothetical protein
LSFQTKSNHPNNQRVAHIVCSFPATAFRVYIYYYYLLTYKAKSPTGPPSDDPKQHFSGKPDMPHDEIRAVVLPFGDGHDLSAASRTSAVFRNAATEIRIRAAI